MSTWGFLRFHLLQTNPGKSLDLLDSWLNTRYQSVLDSTDWTGVHARATLETQAAYKSVLDTVSLTVGSNAVTVTGTTFTNAIIGNRFYAAGDDPLYTVATWVDATHFTLDRPYEGRGIDAPGVIYAAAAYVFCQNVYALPNDCKGVERILDPETEYPLLELTPAEMDASAGPLTSVGCVQSFAPIEDTAEVIGKLTVHQVQLYPAPLLARGYIVEYLRNAFQFNGTNLAQSPLPFVSDDILLNGVRADMALADGKLPQAAAFESLFAKALNRLLMVEFNQRRKKATMRMDQRFTRHRLERIDRGNTRHIC